MKRIAVIILAFVFGQLARAGTAEIGFVGVITTLANSSQTITNNTAPTILFDTNSATDGVYTIHNTSSNKDRCTVPFAGRYICSAWNQWQQNATNVRIIAIQINASSVATGGHVGCANTGNRHHMTTCQQLGNASYFDTVVYQDSGSNITVTQNACGMLVIYLGPP